ncbi:MFS transporter [Gordonia zhaorongruii]|uniref:MFS transporter n=1 Tax=Gordonia zhaorongruii TaxID=2597659 RepID=UPI001F2F84F8|nr:MFS transporter [Gordonia zhaorongruii]
MRLVFGSASALIKEVTHDYDLGSGGAALLTTGPVVCLGLFGVIAARLISRWSVPAVLTGCLALVACGTAIRGLPAWSALVSGTLLAGIGIAVANVLGPVLVRQFFPHRIGLMTGLLTALVSASAGVASGITVPLANNVFHGWRVTLLAWALPAVVATAAMATMAVRHYRHDPLAQKRSSGPRWQSLVLTSPIAWAVTGFMGIQSMLAYSLIGWLPTIYRDRGFSPQGAGLLLTALSVASVLTALTVPIVAARIGNQRLVAVAVTALSVCGLIGVASGGTDGAFVWAVILGLGQGGQLSLALTMINLRAASASTAASLSTMAQSIGYLVAATGPFIAATIHTAMGSWTAPVLFLLIAMVPLAICGWIAAGSNRIGSDIQGSERVVEPVS